MDLTDFNCNYLNKLLENISKRQKLHGDFTTSHSNTLVDKIFSINTDPEIMSGNLIANISNHLPQFSVVPNMFGNILGNKSNIYERGWSKCHRENLILAYFSLNWEDLLKIGELNADNSTKKFLHKINILLDTYAPLERVKK